MVGQAAGPHGELGPLREVYISSGFGHVAAVKVLGLSAMVTILALYERLVGPPRKLALLAATIGLIGAVTNIVGLLGAR